MTHQTTRTAPEENDLLLPKYIVGAAGDFVYPDQDDYWEMLPAWRELQRQERGA